MAYLAQLAALTDELVAAVTAIPEVCISRSNSSFRATLANAQSSPSTRSEMPAASLRCGLCATTASLARTSSRCKTAWTGSKSASMLLAEMPLQKLCGNGWMRSSHAAIRPPLRSCTSCWSLPISQRKGQDSAIWTCFESLKKKLRPH